MALTYPTPYKKGLKKALLGICTGCRNRTYVRSFGDSRTTTVRIPLLFRHSSTEANGGSTKASVRLPTWL